MIISRNTFVCSIQHLSGTWLYNGLDSVSDREAFFNEAPAAGMFKISIKSHFASESLGTELQRVYDIEKGIVETIMGEMIFNPADDVDSDEDDNGDAMEEEQDPGFNSQAELHAYKVTCCNCDNGTRSSAIAV